MNICVFCSSSNAIADTFFNDAERLGELIGLRNHTLINGGANVGLMESVSVAACKSGARTIGIIPQLLKEKNLVSQSMAEIEITEGMMERKERMRNLADAFVALPGGFGTLEEILEVITLKQLDYHRKPIVFVNTMKFYNPMFEQFEVSFSEKFSKPEFRNLYFVADSPEDAIQYIENYEEDEGINKWFIVPGK
ncbi:MAG: TIGR00730 family Rossman fold protein [Prolixibacteraceae bacterium]|nr:TIGR00730 family Rossman fold protein [Prolixibacteraceae bacterium]